MPHTAVIGASLGGLRAVEALRRGGHDGAITLVGAEVHPPYDRPPLSKQVLVGQWEPDRVVLSQADDLSGLDADVRLGCAATGLDADARRVELADGTSVQADTIVLATGARPRQLPGVDGIGGIHVLRTLDDCLALRADLDAAPQRVAVVGAGFIGAEVAATARERNLDVTMIEADATPLGRILGDGIGHEIAALHRAQGVDLRLGVGVARIDQQGGRVTSVVLADGTAVAADVVVVGIGVVPNTDWLEGSGLTIDNGVRCDASLQAAPGVFAIGDLARWPNQAFDGEVMRVEHWDNAVESAMHIAQVIVSGEPVPYTPVPWFWSDQYDRKLQLAGRPRPNDTTEVITGSFAEGRVAVAFGRNGRLSAVFAMNRPRHVMQYRQLIAQGIGWDEALATAREAAS